MLAPLAGAVVPPAPDGPAALLSAAGCEQPAKKTLSTQSPTKIMRILFIDSKLHILPDPVWDRAATYPARDERRSRFEQRHY